MEGVMPGTTVSFIADAKLAARVKEIAKSDGVTQSQAAARASALGALLSPAARRTLRFVLDLGVALAKAIAQVGNSVLERQLLARSQAAGSSLDAQSEEADARRAVDAVAAYRNELADVSPESTLDKKPVSSSGGGD
jgi:hypothetical protein